jgi:hypothetical protein
MKLLPILQNTSAKHFAIKNAAACARSAWDRGRFDIFFDALPASMATSYFANKPCR